MPEKPTYEELEAKVREQEKIIAEIEKEQLSKEEVLNIRELLKFSPFGVFLIDLTGIILYANNSGAERLGKTPDEIIGTYLRSYFPPDISENRRQKGIEAVASGKPQTIEDKVADRWYSSIIHPLKDQNGNIAHLAIYSADLTESKKASEALRESEERYRMFAENVADVIWAMDMNFNFTYVSPSVYPQRGYTAEEVMAHSLEETLLPDSIEIATNLFADKMALIESGNEEGFEPVYFEMKQPCKDGSVIWTSNSARILPDNQKNAGGMLGITRDITHRKMAEKALQESEEKFRALVEQSPLGIALIGKSGRYKYVNPQFVDMFGYSIDDVSTGTEWFQRAFPDEKDRKEAIGAWFDDLKNTGSGQSRPRVFWVTCRDGSRREINFRPVTLDNQEQFVIYEDITERTIMERQLLQAQKMEAIGTLAGGVAHDFNNLLMGIQGRTSLMMMNIDSANPNAEHLEGIEQYVKSATDLTKQLLGFARGGKYEVKSTDINRVVKKSSQMFGRTKKEIKIHFKFQKDIWPVDADPSQIEQVLLNMYVNAWQAMPSGGTLYLQTVNTMLDEDYAKPHFVRPGKYVKISVTDTGIGMDPDIHPKIFDPFFTTKGMGRGTGLGLASSYGIIKNHNGVINVYSEKGKGTTFNIYLPVSESDAVRETEHVSEIVTGTETILLVDDEQLIIDVGKAMIETLGYSVIVAEGGERAVEAVSRAAPEIDLVILDMIMPGMDGGQTFSRIREIRPEIPVILSSGYAINGQATKIMQKGCNGFLQKPFNISELSNKIRKVLDG